jgi:hypothetical protein
VSFVEIHKLFVAKHSSVCVYRNVYANQTPDPFPIAKFCVHGRSFHLSHTRLLPLAIAQYIRLASVRARFFDTIDTLVVANRFVLHNVRRGNTVPGPVERIWLFGPPVNDVPIYKRGPEAAHICC